MRYHIRSDDLENILARFLDNVRRLGLNVSRLTIDVEGEEATLDFHLSDAPDALAHTLGERIALIKGVRSIPAG
ncbi:MAG: hypothetical protein KDJ80_04485 [Nitratireductor sp.]|nr:hypothetical protein [Nitratireductor sp.]